MKLGHMLFVVGLLGVVGTSGFVEADDEPRSRVASRGDRRIAPPISQLRYGKTWALIIGINYDDDPQGPKRPDRDRPVLPKLENAENDASQLRALLTGYYGYQANQVLSNEKGSQATYSWIREQIRKLCDPALVKEDDSVLFFFSGHGARIEAPKDRGAIYPYDVKFSEGRPQNDSFIRIHSDLVNLLGTSPARHKLIILDCCYSGEIFNLHSQPRSEADDRSAAALFYQPCVQAITSCHATQVASDGIRTNSPFTEVLLHGLKQVPARDKSNPIWTNRLYSFMSPELKRLPNGQAPDCRNLESDGEFYFFPDRSKDFASEFGSSASDYRLLQATMASQQGRWWFDEMCWFIPRLRERLMDKLTASKSGLTKFRIPRDALLRRAREETKLEIDSRDANADIQRLALKHVRMLIDTEGTAAFRETLLTIVNDLTAEDVKAELEAVDLHFLAVVQHELAIEDAEETYLKALNAYAGDPVDRSGRASKIEAAKALRALCLADFGEFLMGESSRAREAADYFRRADEEFRSAAPPSFRLFVLCREASAWLQLNRWADANNRLEDAINIANTFDSEHFLAAFVHRQRAWAQMIQWEIAEAQKSFARSNEILSKWSRNTSDDTTQTVPKAEQPDAGDSNRQFYSTTSRTFDPLQHFWIDESIRRTGDFHAKIIYFHNLHGLAMAQRFHGRTDLAARKYRWLATEVENALWDLRQVTGEIDGNSETELVQRMINTLERLADCNLFGDPTVRDLSEAEDDYRRALARVPSLPSNRREQWLTKLFYKQALATSLPSPIQDTELALAMCAEADRIYTDRAANAVGLERALGQLTTKVVNLIATNPDASTDPRGESDEIGRAEKRDELRQTLIDFRDAVGAHPHRDELELCLFAAKLLLDHGQEQDHFRLDRDIELLLSFCRIALRPYRLENSQSGRLAFGGESSAYLRPYFDTAMRHTLRTQLKHVKDMLQIQWEAVRGYYYVKVEEADPVLALYVLDGACYLLYDLPHGASRHVSLADDCTVEEIVNACWGGQSTPRLRLPREVEKTLTAWGQEIGTTGEPTSLECRWEDPIVGLGGRRTRTVTEASSRLPSDALSNEKEANRQINKELELTSRFPFELPSTIVVKENHGP